MEPKVVQPGDSELWNSFREDSREAFAQIYAQHYRSLYAYGKKFLVDVTLTEDAIQELFINLWRTRARLSAVDNIKFYLFRSLRRDIRRLAERERRSQSEDFGLIAEIADPAEFLSFAENDEETLLTRRLKALIAQLPQRQREVVILRFYENFQVDEITAIMGITEKTVRNTLFNAIVALRSGSDILKSSL